MKKGLDMYRLRLLTLALLIGMLALAAWHVTLRATVAEAPPVIGQAATPMVPTAGHPPHIDHSAVDWEKVPAAPDPSPLSVAAYGV
jgi:hypothetical protein